MLFDCESHELPFGDRLGLRGRAVTFEKQFSACDARDRGLVDDVVLLSELKEAECSYGAACCPLYPFLCEERSEGGPLTGAAVLASLLATDFHSEHIRDLNATAIPYPGYRPGTVNDEVHTDFSGQYMFPKVEEEEGGPGGEMEGNHGLLKRHVRDRKLWYVLLHTQFRRPSWRVILFAVGRSPHGKWLVGAVTHQNCHNLCD
jgi:hypothetical protein